MRRRFTLVMSTAAAAACAGRSSPPAAPAPIAARAPAPAPPRDPSRLRYAPGAGRYHTMTEGWVEVMGQQQTFDSHLYISAVVSAAGANVGVAVTIDSASGTGPGNEGLGAARGRAVSLVFTPTGQPVAMTSADSANPAIMGLSVELRELLPQLPVGAIGVRTTWSDTLTRHVPAPGVNLTMNIARQHRVVGWEDRDGVRVLHLSTTGTYTMTGTGEAPGQSLEFSGTGRNAAEQFVSAAGVYLGGTSADTADVNVNVVSAGMQVSTRRVQRASVTRLP